MATSLRERHPGLAFASAVVLALTLVPLLTGTARANHGSATLDVEPDSSTRGVGTNHTMTATLSQTVTAEQGTVQVDFENEDGVNDGDGDTPTSPDLNCQIPTGEESCTVGYVGETVGDDTWRSWIDHDGMNSTTEADPNEGVNEIVLPGVQPPPCGNSPEDMGGPLEPDCTDVVEITWSAGGPALLDCDDSGSGADTERETNPSGGGAAANEDYTCTVTDAFGNPAEDPDPNNDDDEDTVEVFGEVENEVNDPDGVDGASYNTPDYDCSVDREDTEEDGVCEITVTQNEAQTGTAEVCFWTSGDGATLCGAEGTGESQAGNGADTGNDLADQVEKTWATDLPECNDGVDNDGDGDTDFPDDADCESPEDDSEDGGINGCNDENAIVGTDGDDTLVGTPDDDLICGLGGDDAIEGLGGNDTILGQGGKDTIEGDGGRDDIRAGRGRDVVSGGRGKDQISGGSGRDQIDGNGGNDTVNGSGGNDTVRGNKGNDTLKGAGGDDTLQGGNGRDILRGGKSRDVLKGGKKRDILDGGPGNDTCRGGPGKDEQRRC